MSKPECYIALRECGCLMGAVSTSIPDQDVAKSIAKWAKRGGAIQPATAEEIRNRQLKCDQHRVKQKSLLTTEGQE